MQANATGDGQDQGRAVAQRKTQLRRQFAKRLTGRICGDTGDPAARWLAEEEHHHRQQQPGTTQEVEAVPPADGRAEVADDQQARADTDGHAHVVDARRQSQPARRKLVAEQGHGRRRHDRLANADEHAWQRQRDEAAGHPRQRRQRTPRRQPGGNQPGAVVDVGQGAHEEAHGRIEHQEYQSGQQSELGIGEAEVRHDEVGETREQLPVDEVHDIEQREKSEEADASRGDAVIFLVHVSSPWRALPAWLALRQGPHHAGVVRHHGWFTTPG